MADVNMKVLSNEPEDFITGGLLNDVDLEILEAKYTLDKPDHYTFSDRIFTLFRMKDLSTGAEVDQFWAAGSMADFVPSPDGNFCLPNPDNPTATALRKSSNWFAMLNSLRTNGGMPKGFLNGPAGLSALKGLRFHGIQVAAPERPGLEKKESKFPPTILTCSKVLPGPAPWDKAKGGAKGKTEAAAAQAAAVTPGPTPVAEASGDSDDLIATALRVVIEASPDKSLPANKDNGGAAMLVFRQLVAQKVANAIRKASSAKVLDVAWLEQHGFMVEGGTIVSAI
jgi:hypothetical protein